jgi:DNA-binding MarR family transcriptional regulator
MGPARPTTGQHDVVRVDPDFTDEYPEADPRSTEAYVALLIAGELLNRELGRRIEHTLDVSHNVFNALAVIDGADEALTPSQISERMVISSATMTSMLDVLEDRKWIQRTPNPDDRRSVLIQITPAGRATTDQVIPGIHDIERQTMSVLTAKEQTQLVTLVAKVLGQVGLITTGPAEPLSGTRNRPARLS